MHQDRTERTEHVLDLIDRTLGDDTVSDDAMRAVPDPDEVPACGHTYCMGADDCRIGPPALGEDAYSLFDEQRGWRGWRDVGYATDTPLAFAGFEVDEDHHTGAFAALYRGDHVSVGPFPAPPSPRQIARAAEVYRQACVVEPWPGETYDETGRWGRADDVPEYFLRPPLAHYTLAHYTTDEHGNIRDQHGHLVLDGETVQRQLRDLGAFVGRARAALVHVGESCREAMVGVHLHLARAGIITVDVPGDDVDPDESPWDRALRLRRERNTGPHRDPHRHRGMR